MKPFQDDVSWFPLLFPWFLQVSQSCSQAPRSPSRSAEEAKKRQAAWRWKNTIEIRAKWSTKGSFSIAMLNNYQRVLVPYSPKIPREWCSSWCNSDGVGATLAVVGRSRTKEEEKAAKEAEKESWPTQEQFVDVWVVGFPYTVLIHHDPSYLYLIVLSAQIPPSIWMKETLQETPYFMVKAMVSWWPIHEIPWKLPFLGSWMSITEAEQERLAEAERKRAEARVETFVEKLLWQQRTYWQVRVELAIFGREP